MDLTLYMIQLREIKDFRVALNIYVAPGRAQDLCKWLRDKPRSYAAAVHSDSSVRVEDQRDVVRLLSALEAPTVDAMEALRASQLHATPGVARPEWLKAELRRRISELLETQGD